MENGPNDHDDITSSLEEGSSFENTLQKIESTLELIYTRYGNSLPDSLKGLKRLSVLERVKLEAALSSIAIISLDEDDYARLHDKIMSLLVTVKQDCINQGLDPVAILQS